MNEHDDDPFESMADFFEHAVTSGGTVKFGDRPIFPSRPRQKPCTCSKCRRSPGWQERSVAKIRDEGIGV